jgi:hypothetical protein
VSAEIVLERCIGRLEANIVIDQATGEVKAFALPPHDILVQVQKSLRYDDNDLGGPEHSKAYIRVREAAGETLTTWWEGRGRTHDECLKLFKDALWQEQIGGDDE